MASKSKLKRLAKRRAAAASPSSENGTPTTNQQQDESILLSTRNATKAVNPELTSMINVTDRSVLSEQDAAGDEHLIATGLLVSHPGAPDIRIDKFSVSQYGLELVEDTELVLNQGQRYGLIGLNGSGKTSMMTALGRRLVPIPPHFSTYFLEGAHPASDLTALDAVVNSVEEERKKLESELEEIESMPLAKMDMDRADWISSKIDALMSTEEARAKAASILHGLGFTQEMQQKATKDFSGGWRMRISLACALLLRPDLLLLDEPTNHLDLEACVWLEEYLKNYDGILVIVSHSQDFMNGICTSIILLRNKKLSYFTGDYDTYVKTREELEINQMKQYNREQDELKNMKEYIARFGHGSAKLARQAKSKEKTMAKMIEKGLTEKVTKDRVFRFRLPPCGSLPLPIIQIDEVAFGYPGGEELFSDVNLSIDLESRVAIVGKNGSGKSTFLKLMLRQLMPTRGSIVVNGHLRIGYFHQHLTESLPGDKSALEFLLEKFPDEYEHNSIGIERFRSRIGPYLQGKLQTAPISTLSDGQKVRIAFCFLALQKPHVLLLDEPTNNLDMESIDSLAEAIEEWDGGVVLVSHDFRLLEQCCDEIWECKDRKIKRFDGDILTYKDQLRKDVLGY